MVVRIEKTNEWGNTEEIYSHIENGQTCEWDKESLEELANKYNVFFKSFEVCPSIHAVRKMPNTELIQLGYKGFDTDDDYSLHFPKDQRKCFHQNWLYPLILNLQDAWEKLH